jgi:hypothetical protein
LGETTIWIDVGVVNKHAPSYEGRHDLEDDYADLKFKKYEDLVKVICGLFLRVLCRANGGY